MQQDQAEAKTNVETRLGFIRGETLVLRVRYYNRLLIQENSKRVEAQIKEIEEKQEKKKAEVCSPAL